MRKPRMWYLNTSDTNQAVLAPTMAGGLKVLDLESRGIVLSM